MLNFNSLLLFSQKPEALSEFYKKILDHEPEWTDGDYSGFKVGSGFLVIGGHDKVKGVNENPQRIILNFETKDVKTEFTRIQSLGAEVISEPYNPGKESDMWIATFADTDGNYFQLITPMPKKE